LTVALVESEAACGEGLNDPAEIAQWQADIEAAVRLLGSAEGPERELFRLLLLRAANSSGCGYKNRLTDGDITPRHPELSAAHGNI
jgi:hypothetical protein